jgi:alanine-synthesizing transaminase
MFSRRSDIEDATNDWYLERQRSQGRGAILDLTEWNPTRLGICPSEAELHELSACIKHSGLRSYDPDPRGSLRARGLLAEEISHTDRLVSIAACSTSADDLLLTTSTSEAYSYLFKLLCEPGDCVLVPSPSYPLFHSLAMLDGLRLEPYPLYFDTTATTWLPDHGYLARFRGKRGVIVCVSPNNPTGGYVRPADLQAMHSVGMPIILDRVFDRWRIEPSRGLVAGDVASTEGLVFELFGLSKQCLLPQWKLAWTRIRGEARLVAEAKRRLGFIGDTYLSVATPVQEVLPQLLSIGTRLLGDALGNVRANLSYLHAVHAEVIVANRPEGGAHAIIRLPGFQSSLAWAVLLMKSNIAVMPGSFYGLHGSNVVVSLLLPPEAFRTAVDALANLLREPWPT